MAFEPKAVLRPTLAFGALVVAVALLSPTIASVGEAVEGFDFRRELPWALWKWDTKVLQPLTPQPTSCSPEPIPTESEVTKWPRRIDKNETFTLGGHVIVPSESGRGLAGVKVDLFLNETKTEPGDYLGTVITDAEGQFMLDARIPHDLPATRYHLVAHAYEISEGCRRYEEHWSDPELEVTSTTRIELDIPPAAVAGKPTVVSGQLLDGVGAPVRDKNVLLYIGSTRQTIRTDDNGSFSWERTVKRPEDLEVRARFTGTNYYDPSEARGTLSVVGEDVRFDGEDAPDGLVAVRSRAFTLHGRIVLPPGTVVDSSGVIAFSGFRVVACADCEPTSTLPLETDAQGAFTVKFTVPPEETPGLHELRVSGGGLTVPVEREVTVVAPSFVDVTVEDTGWFEQRLAGSARVYDDRGDPLNGTLALSGPLGWRDLTLSRDGTVTFEAVSPCGRQTARVVFNGTRDHLGNDAQQNVVVCPMASLLKPLGVPWWVWLAAVVIVGVALGVTYSWWRGRTPTLSRGPPLTLTLVTSDDLPADLIGLGEATAATLKLERPLPAGHTLRVVLNGETATVTPDPATHVVTHMLVPKETGKAAVRAEILDAKGRVVTRRTVFLRVVRYAEEIEERYLSLKRDDLGETADRVSPREFEAWLRQHADDLDPEVARRLVAIFEEADYGPREAGRRELVGYLEAERRLRRGRPAAR